MPETQQVEQYVPEPEKASELIETPQPPRIFRAPVRRFAVVLLIVFLIVLQVVLGWIVVVQAWKILDLGARIERMEQK